VPVSSQIASGSVLLLHPPTIKAVIAKAIGSEMAVPEQADRGRIAPAARCSSQPSRTMCAIEEDG
jgi:hypothetical protein